MDILVRPLHARHDRPIRPGLSTPNRLSASPNVSITDSSSCGPFRDKRHAVTAVLSFPHNIYCLVELLLQIFVSVANGFLEFNCYLLTKVFYGISNPYLRKLNILHFTF